MQPFKCQFRKPLAHHLVLGLTLVVLSTIPPMAGCRSTEFNNFAATTIDGNAFNTSDHRGKVLLINVFATWCGPCIHEMPHLVRMYEQYNQRGLMMVAVAGDTRESVESVRKFAEQHNIPFPVIPPDSRVIDSIGGINAFPTTIIVDREGIVRRRIIGAHVEEIEKTVNDLLDS